MRIVNACALLAAIVGCASCQPSATPPQVDGETDRRALLSHFVDVTVLPLLQRLETQAADLVSATVALQATAGVDDGARATARAAVATVQTTWQQLEVMQLGPAGAQPTFTGGKSLRDGLHSWPLVSPCSVDQQLLQNQMAEPGWASTRLVNVIGLHSLEYLLFRGDAENACPAAASINAAGTWAALSDEEIVARRAVYARVLADDLLAKVKALRGLWTDGFGQDLKSAGQSGSSFATAQQALDEVYAALFFVELKTKDRKLGVPAGLHIDCSAAVCPDLTESPFSRLSLEHIEHNLLGARLVVVGAVGPADDGVGFADLLGAADHDEAAVEIVQNLDAAIAAARDFTGTIEAALVSEPQRVLDLHAAVKGFADDLKSTLPSLLSLRVPAEGAGDND